MTEIGPKKLLYWTNRDLSHAAKVCLTQTPRNGTGVSPRDPSEMTLKLTTHADRNDGARTSVAPDASNLLADQLRLSGHMLQALESGRMPMNAAGYLEVVGWVRDEFERMSSGELGRWRARVPGSLQCVVENVLHARGETRWATDAQALSTAQSQWTKCVQWLKTTRRDSAGGDPV